MATLFTGTHGPWYDNPTTPEELVQKYVTDSMAAHLNDAYFPILTKVNPGPDVPESETFELPHAARGVNSNPIGEGQTAPLNPGVAPPPVMVKYKKFGDAFQQTLEAVVFKQGGTRNLSLSRLINNAGDVGGKINDIFNIRAAELWADAFDGATYKGYHDKPLVSTTQKIKGGKATVSNKLTGKMSEDSIAEAIHVLNEQPNYAGRPLGANPDLLICAPRNRFRARRILQSIETRAAEGKGTLNPLASENIAVRSIPDLGSAYEGNDDYWFLIDSRFLHVMMMIHPVGIIAEMNAIAGAGTKRFDAWAFMALGFGSFQGVVGSDGSTGSY